MRSRISVNEHDFEISVCSTHTLDDDKAEITSLIDSQHVTGVHFSFSGTVDHSTSISPRDMLRSSAVQSFHHYLAINGKHLGIIDISEVILDDGAPGAPGVPKVFVTPTRCAGVRTSPHARILSIHLAYNWKPLAQLSSGLSIFSPQTLLPLQPALNKLMQKLFSVHIVGRYPWLFGPLRTKLHLECRWFPSLVRSLLAITDRSRNLIFRNNAQALVKKIENQVSVYKQVMGANNSQLSSPSMSRSCPSDSSAPDISDTLISALELVLKIATRPPPFKGACLYMTSTQPSSDDETSGLSGFHHPSEDFAGDTFHWDDLLPTSPCLSGGSLTQLFDDNLWSSDSEEMVLGNSMPDSAYQSPLPDGAGYISLASQSIWDSEEEDNGLAPCDVSPPPESGPCTGMNSELRCSSAHESFIALDHNVDAPPDLCNFDEDGDEDGVMLLAYD